MRCFQGERPSFEVNAYLVGKRLGWGFLNALRFVQLRRRVCWRPSTVRGARERSFVRAMILRLMGTRKFLFVGLWVVGWLFWRLFSAVGGWFLFIVILCGGVGLWHVGGPRLPSKCVCPIDFLIHYCGGFKKFQCWLQDLTVEYF